MTPHPMTIQKACVLNGFSENLEDFVIITLLITYKIFMLSEPDVQRFLKQIRKTYKAQHPRAQAQEIREVGDDNVEDIEATGAIAGTALEVIIRKGL